eukprot:gene12903-27218_t
MCCGATKIVSIRSEEARCGKNFVIHFAKYQDMEEEKRETIKEVLPKTGLVYSERGGLSEVLCKPKIMPLKSAVLEQLQKIEAAADQNDDEKEEKS